MKNFKFIIAIICLSISISSFGQLTGKAKRQQQKKLKMQEIEQLVENQKFSFVPQSLTTSSGYTKDLISSYDLVLKQDSAMAYLPFWGTAYMAKINDEGGIKFEALAEDLDIKDRGKKGYELTFDVNNMDDNYQVRMSISKSGYATLNITSTKKSHISYYGQIHPLEKNE